MLGVHLENEQPVFMFEQFSLPEALEGAETSELPAFFKYNPTIQEQMFHM